MENSKRLTAEVFIDTGKDFRPEDSLQAEYTCTPGETITLEFDLSIFEHTCGFRFDPLLEDSSMVKLLDLTLTYEDGESKTIERSRIKTNSDVDFEPIFVYLHKDPKFFVDEALCLKLAKAKVSFQVLELGPGEKDYWQEIKKHSVSEKEKEQLLNKLELAMNQNRTFSEKEIIGPSFRQSIWPSAPSCLSLITPTTQLRVPTIRCWFSASCASAWYGWGPLC